MKPCELNKDTIKTWPVKACPELATAQPQLVQFLIKSSFICLFHPNSWLLIFTGWMSGVTVWSSFLTLKWCASYVRERAILRFHAILQPVEQAQIWVMKTLCSGCMWTPVTDQKVLFRSIVMSSPFSFHVYYYTSVLAGGKFLFQAFWIVAFLHL